MRRRCPWCRRPLPDEAHRARVYCDATHRGAFYRFKRAAHEAAVLIDGGTLPRFPSPAAYAETNRTVARVARVGRGRGMFRPAKRCTNANARVRNISASSGRVRVSDRERALSAIRRLASRGVAPKVRHYTRWHTSDEPSVSTIVAMFGSWSAACEAADLTPRRRGRPERSA